MENSHPTVNIIGAGLAGLSSALTLAKNGWQVRLISAQASERAQSNLAEGGINAAINAMGDGDSLREHYLETMQGGCELADPNMVRNLVENAPRIAEELMAFGVPFQREEGRIVQRHFGGSKKMRTLYVKSSTGKSLTVALIDEVRKYEATGQIERLCHHRFVRLLYGDEAVLGVEVQDVYTGERIAYDGPVIMACGGCNGLFAGHTTGTTANTGSAAALLFAQGVAFANLEFLQYHPTTVEISEKRLLISEAARGEGGRLFSIREDGSRFYFMEEAYGTGGNLMPRDVVSREMVRQVKPVYLDMTGLDASIWENRLSDMREELLHYLHMDPAAQPIPVSPGIHYFMGGIYVDAGHHTNMDYLYAAGECAAAYHGANRLGGNSLLGAIYGGQRTAISVMEDCGDAAVFQKTAVRLSEAASRDRHVSFMTGEERETDARLREILISAMGIFRTEESLLQGRKALSLLYRDGMSDELAARLFFAEAMVDSAEWRKESRGAHQRSDYPLTSETCKKTTVAKCVSGTSEITFADIPALREGAL